MRFEEVYDRWHSGGLSQVEAADILGVTDRTFRRYIHSYESLGLEGLSDKRIERASHRKAPVDEVMRLHESYGKDYRGWNVKHFYSWYKKDGGTRSYSWVKDSLQSAQLVKKLPSKGKHRKRRERSPLPGMMIHQDASTHLWVPGVYWDLVVTMDDATNEHYSMFFVEEEGTQSSLMGVKETIEAKGLFCSFTTATEAHTTGIHLKPVARSIKLT